jgi:hypothetical protein
MSNKVTQKNKVKVLYQNLGGIWYAFAQSGADVYFGRVPMNLSAEKTFKILKQQAGQGVAGKESPKTSENNRSNSKAA